MKQGRPKVKFCKNGHEIAIFGRNKWGSCNACYAPVAMGLQKKKPKKQFCVHGHDLTILGRYPDGSCKGCKKALNHPKQPKMICVRGHDISVCGRNKFGRCWDCASPPSRRGKIGQPKKKFCKHGHDISVVGRNLHGQCNQCVKDQYQARREEILEIKRIYHINHREERLAYGRKFRKEHPEYSRAHTSIHSKKRRLRIPKWADWKEIEEIYRTCPKGWVVDHAIPLIGKLVSGLHVSWNLQHLTEDENKKKRDAADLVSISVKYGELLKSLGLK